MASKNDCTLDARHQFFRENQPSISTVSLVFTRLFRDARMLPEYRDISQLVELLTLLIRFIYGLVCKEAIFNYFYRIVHKEESVSVNISFGYNFLPTIAIYDW